MSRRRLSKISEAATIKSKVLRISREMAALLTDKTLPESLRKQVESFRASLNKTWAELEKEAGQEHGHRGVAGSKESLSNYDNNPIGEASMAKTKSVSGKNLPASAFLVVPDPESPSTWSLPVKGEDGKPDPRLMGAAHAALMKNFRGQSYKGPDKQKAITALKKMYADMDMEWPKESEKAEEMSEAEAAQVAEYMDDMSYVPVNITSFAQLRTAQAAQEVACDMREAVEQFQMMINNIFLWSSPEQIPDKVQAATTLFDEFIGVMDEILSGEGEGGNMAMMGGEATPTEEAAPAADPEPENVTETEGGDPISLSESYEEVITLAEEAADANPRGPLTMQVQLIKPGWGNSRDNHYYPAEMLRRCAEAFVGAKMYTTDHKQEEKSERTEVSQIKAISGFSDAGAPIAEVVVFDPDFAEKCRNRKKARMLESLECSILADGKARAGFEEGGRKGKVVESITSVSSVDWVTRAGAGGKAIALAESDAQPEPEETPAPVEEAAPVTEPVTINEQAQETPAEPVYLGEAEIREALGKVNLPGASVLSLALAKYETIEALQEAIQAEIKHIKEVTGSGRPFGLGESAPVEKQPVSQSQIEETMDKVNKKYGFGR